MKNLKEFKKFFFLFFLIAFFIFVFNFSLIFAQENENNIFKNIFNFLINKILPNKTESQNNQQPFFLNIPTSITSLEDVLIQVSNNTSPAVVSIVISKYVPVLERYYVSPFDDFDLPEELKPFFEFRIPQLREKGKEKQKVGGGTGFIVSSDGLIVTNKHVVKDKDAEYTVYLNDGRKFNAKVLVLHPTDDLALIKINARNLPYLKLGDSDRIKIGQFVLAIGNALGEFQNTVSFGVISGLRRSLVASDESGSVERLEEMIQTDAGINFGNSGGPLINLRGEVIGVNTAIASGAENIGFAIPINKVKKMINDYKNFGRIEIPFLGVYYILINDEVQKEFNLPVNYGAYVYSEDKNPIIKNSPAEKAGLKNGDIILEIDKEKINAYNSLSQIIQKKNVGQKINIKILRNDKEINLEVILGALPKNLP